MPIEATIDSKQFEKSLQNLKASIVKKILRPAITKATRVLTKEVKRLQKVRTKMLRKAYSQKIKTYDNAVIGIVGVTDILGTYKGKRVRPVKYQHLVEEGTYRSKAYRYLKQAKTNKLFEIRAILTREIEAGIQKHAK